MNPIVNIADAALETIGNGEKFVARFGSLTAALGAKKLGVSLCELAPGKRAFPRHAHHVNEEMMLILDGEGTYHSGDESVAVKAGDVISAPPGDASTAHQIENTSDAPLRYLTISTRLEPEVVEYPDSGKFAVMSHAGQPVPRIRFLGRAEDTLGYYDGEA